MRLFSLQRQQLSPPSVMVCVFTSQCESHSRRSKMSRTWLGPYASLTGLALASSCAVPLHGPISTARSDFQTTQNKESSKTCFGTWTKTIVSEESKRAPRLGWALGPKPAGCPFLTEGACGFPAARHQPRSPPGVHHESLEEKTSHIHLCIASTQLHACPRKTISTV